MVRLMTRKNGELMQAINGICTPEEGVRVLWVSVIHQAYLDATGKEPAATVRERARRACSAIEYFYSERYRERCEMLGIRPIVPPEVAQAKERFECIG
jgi:hypothetical protein